jgi:hypothetical protein
VTGPSVGADERAGDEAVGRGGDTARGAPRRRRKRSRPIWAGKEACGGWGRAPRLSMAEKRRSGRKEVEGCGNAEVRVGEAVVGERGARGVGEQRAGGEEKLVQLEEAAGEREVLPEEALEDGEWVRGGAPHPETATPAAASRRRQNILQAESDRARSRSIHLCGPRSRP